MSNLIPILRQTENNWHLYVSHDEDVSLDLQIKFAFHGGTDGLGWNKYRFYVNTSQGDSFELVSENDYLLRYKVVELNEGPDIAHEWAESEVVQCPGQSNLPLHRYLNTFRELVLKWEAMQTLKLFRPSVTMTGRWDK